VPRLGTGDWGLGTWDREIDQKNQRN